MGGCPHRGGGDDLKASALVLLDDWTPEWWVGWLFEAVAADVAGVAGVAGSIGSLPDAWLKLPDSTTLPARKHPPGLQKKLQPTPTQIWYASCVEVRSRSLIRLRAVLEYTSFGG